MPSYFRGLNILVALFTIYGMVRLTGGRYIVSGVSVDALYSLKKAYISLIPIYAYFYYSKIGQLNTHRLKRYSLLFLALAFMAYFSYYAKRYGFELDEEWEYTNNSGYKFLALMPIILFWRNRPLIFYSFLALTIIMIIMCMKRGAIVSGAIALGIILFYSTKKMSGNRKAVVIFLTIGLLIGLFKYVNYLVENNEYFMHRYNDTMAGDANGRDTMYPMFFNYILNRENIFTVLFGDGLDGSIKNFGIYCHNDWFEMTIDEGFLGLGCFIFYWIGFYKIVRKFKSDAWIYVPILTIFTTNFFNTLFSFSINNMSISVTCVLSYCLAQSSFKSNNRVYG